MKTFNVGILGYGMAGRVFHAPLIDYVEGLNLSQIRESRQENIEIARERYPNAEIVSDTQDILNNPEIDLVVLAVPNKHHFHLAKETLNAGKNVVVEKPFTVTSEEAQELINLANRKNKILTVYQNRRFDSDFLTIKKILDSGKLGRLVEYEAHYDRFVNYIRPSPWKEEGSLGTGLLYDLGSHLIDQALILFGMPDSVTADIRIQRDNSKIPDNFTLQLEFGQLKVTIKSSMLVKEPLPKYILQGTNGSFVKYGQDIQEHDLNEFKKSFDDHDWGLEPEENWGVLNVIEGDMDKREKIPGEKGDYSLYYKNVYKALAGEEELEVKPRQAYNTIKIIEMAMKSHTMKSTINL